MKTAFGLFLTSLALLPGIASAQSNGGEFRSQPSPPPLPHSPQNPAGGPSQPSAPPPPPAGPAKPVPGGNALGGLVGYPDARMQTGPDDIEAPVTGYGNEALWDAGLMADSPPPSSAARRNDATGSTAGRSNR